MTRRTKIIGIISIIVVAISVFAFSRRQDPNANLQTVTVEPRDVVQEVTFSGRLQAVQEANLGFQVGGIVAGIPVQVGQTVHKGQTLIQLDSRAASLQVAKSQADLASTGEQAYSAWQNAEDTWENTKTVNAKSIEKQKQVVRDAKAELDQAQKVWEATKDEYDEDSSTARTSYAAYLAKRSLYNAAQQTLTELNQSTKNSTDSARAAADVAKQQYDATHQASESVAGLSSLEALQQIASVQLSYNAIVAPFDGVIGSITPTVGEFAAAGTTQVSIQSVDQLKITSDVIEADAAKLSTNLSADITFDVFPNEDPIAGTLATIAPVAKIIEGVPTYEATVTLVESDSRLRPGFTANVSIVADERKNVLAIPRRAIVNRDGVDFVRVLGDDGFIAEHPVRSGLIGSDGSIEILSGLQTGMHIITNPSRTSE